MKAEQTVQIEMVEYGWWVKIYQNGKMVDSFKEPYQDRAMTRLQDMGFKEVDFMDYRREVACK